MYKLALILAGIGIGFYLFVCYGIWLVAGSIRLAPELVPQENISASFDDVWPLTTGLQGEEHSIQLQPARSLNE